METLVALVAAAFTYSTYELFAGGDLYCDTAVLFGALLLLGRYFEARAKGRVWRLPGRRGSASSLSSSVNLALRVASPPTRPPALVTPPSEANSNCDAADPRAQAVWRWRTPITRLRLNHDHLITPPRWWNSFQDHQTKRLPLRDALDSNMDVSQGIAQVAAAIAAHGLATSFSPLPREPLASEQWAALSTDVKKGRVPGLWVQAIADGTLATTPTQAQEASTAHAVAMGVAALLERFLLETVGVLTAASIDYRTLKGPAVAHLDYPDTRLRTFGDIDLLVPADQFDRAVAALVVAGYARRVPQLRPGFERRFGKGAVLHGPGGLELDLHRTFVSGPFGLWSQPADLFATSAAFEVAGEELQALSAEDRFVHACFHAALSRRVRLSSIRDVAQLLLNRPLDLDLIRRRSRAWKADAVLARGVTLTWDTLGLADATPLSVWAAGYEPDRHELRAIRASLCEAGERPSKALEGFRALPDVRRKAAYARAFLSPSAQRCQVGHFRRWWRAVRLVPDWLRLRRGANQSEQRRVEDVSRRVAG